MKDIKKSNIIFNKNGNGFLSIKINLPLAWIKELGFTNENREAIIEINNDKITIKKYTEENEKDILLSQAKVLLEKLKRRETHGDRRNSKKACLNDILTKLYQMDIDIDFVKNYGYIKELKKYEKTATMDRQVKVIYNNDYKFI